MTKYLLLTEKKQKELKKSRTATTVSNISNVSKSNNKNLRNMNNKFIEMDQIQSQSEMVEHSKSNNLLEYSPFEDIQNV